MKVLLEARRASRGLGIGTFVERLAPELAADGRVELCQWGTSGPTRNFNFLRDVSLFDISPRLDPRCSKFDVIHFTSNTCPAFPPRASVLTLHDLIRRGRLRDDAALAMLKHGISRVGRIVAVSGDTLRAALQWEPSLSEKCVVIPHGVRRGLGLTRETARTHLLAFAGVDERKRSRLMAEIYAQYRVVAANPLPLVVLARAGIPEDSRRILMACDAQIRDDCMRSEVDKLLSTAAALLFTSREEGFALPVVEAGEFGTRVVLDATARIPQEARGNHCEEVTGGIREWVDALVRQVERGPADSDSALPSWSDVAAQYLELYEEVA